MSFEYSYVHEYWRLSVENTLPHYHSTWVKMTLDENIVEVVESLGGRIHRIMGVILFDSVEDVTVFRLRTGV